MNCINLIGRLAQNPDMKFFETGSNVAKFPLAVNRPPRDGEQIADFFNCECWGKLAEVVSNYCHKGKQVAVTGRIEYEHWQDKTTGENRSKPVVKIERLDLLAGSKSNDKDDSEF